MDMVDAYETKRIAWALASEEVITVEITAQRRE